MSNMRDEMLAKTAKLRPTSSIREDEVKRSSRVQTAPGLAGALAVSQLRVQELEESGVASELPVDQIVSNPWQPRRVFNESRLLELAESIREVGLLQAIVVRRVGSGYQIIAGERRWRAHKMLGLDVVKASVADCSDADMAVFALVENLNRDDLSDYETATSIRRGEREFPNRTRMAAALGLSRWGLYQFLAFDQLPDFIRNDLDLQPRLLGANAAQDIASTLAKYGDDGIRAARDLWSAVVSGDLTQSKFSAAVVASLKKNEFQPDAGSRTIEKLFAGKAQVGNITKDARGFTVKFRSGMLTDQQETEIRGIIGRFFSNQPRD